LKLKKLLKKQKKWLESPKCFHTHMKILIFYLKNNNNNDYVLHFASSVALPWMATPPAVIELASCLATPPAVIDLRLSSPHVGGPICNFCKKERRQ
jgi:hypothetical protein